MKNFTLTSSVFFPFTAGVISSSSFIFSMPILFFLGCGLFVISLTEKSVKKGDVTGLFYGFGYYFPGLFWVFSKGEDYSNEQLLSTLALGSVLISLFAFFYGVLGLLATIIPIKKRRNILWYFGILLPLFTFHEWVNTWAFTGFPWFQASHLFIDSYLSSWFPLVGEIGVSFIVYALVLIFVSVFTLDQKRKLIEVFSLLLGVGFLVTSLLEGREYTQADQSNEINVQVLQDQASDYDKYSYAGSSARFIKYLNYVVSQEKLDISVWPESSVNTRGFRQFLQEHSEVIDQLSRNGTDILMGVYVKISQSVVNNVIFSTKADKNLYSKQHLVPVGEYMPTWFSLFSFWFSSSLNSPIVADHGLSGSFEIKGVKVTPSICFEIMFSEEMRKRSRDSGYMVSVSDLSAIKPAWAKAYMLDIARMRAKEFQKPLLLSVNKGESAIISKMGRLIGERKFSGDVVTATIKLETGMTPYEKYGFFYLLIVNGLLLIVSFFYLILRKGS